MNELRVLFVCGGNNPDFGIAPFISSQAESLRRQGVIVDFYLIRGKGFMGYLSHVIPLRKKMHQGGYHVIHAHYTFCGWVARLATWKVPLVVSYMGSDFAGVFGKNGQRKPKSLLMIAQGMLLNILVKHVIVKSKVQLKLLPVKRRARVIPNGVDFSRFFPFSMEEARRNLGLDGSKIFGLFLGNPADPRKNFTLAEEACAIASESIPLDLLVPYPVTPEQVPQYLNAVNVLVFTSLFEGSSNLLKEALACNCPVIATPAGDAGELIPGIEQSKIIPYNTEAAAEEIVQVLSKGHRSNGRSHIDHLREEVVAQNLIRLYHEAIGKSQRHERN
jgi:teichuronic acid biosynthesis glycosyltransferase TuaC